MRASKAALILLGHYSMRLYEIVYFGLFRESLIKDSHVLSVVKLVFPLRFRGYVSGKWVGLISDTTE